MVSVYSNRRLRKGNTHMWEWDFSALKHLINQIPQLLSCVYVLTIRTTGYANLSLVQITDKYYCFHTFLLQLFIVSAGVSWGKIPQSSDTKKDAHHRWRKKNTCGFLPKTNKHLSGLHNVLWERKNTYWNNNAALNMTRARTHTHLYNTLSWMSY